MKRKDYKFFFGWSVALFIATMLWCIIGKVMNTSSLTLHIISGVICIISAISTIIFSIFLLKNHEKE